jgi:hypothetical protein
MIIATGKLEFLEIHLCHCNRATTIVRNNDGDDNNETTITLHSYTDLPILNGQNVQQYI